tara:strand:+ start:2101 stop:3027 length:927 start_codon:yes stop_codon:yes gene_type:complete
MSKKIEGERELEKFVFIVTKPLQILVATAIKDQLPGDSYFVLVVIDGFSLSQKVSNNIRGSELGWDSVVWGRTKAEVGSVVAKLKPTNVFIDSDIGLKNLIYLAKLKICAGLPSLFVYEEGVGTYRSDLYLGLKRTIFQVFGIGVNFGGSAFSDGIYVYDDEAYASVDGRVSKSCTRIKKTISCILRENLLVLERIFESRSFFESVKVKNEVCHVYLSSWKVDEAAVELLAKKDGDRYMKTHPHIKSSDYSDLNSELVVIPSHLPAEIVLGFFVNCYKRVFVYHHGSSVCRYMPESSVLKYNLIDSND